MDEELDLVTLEQEDGTQLTLRVIFIITERNT